MARLPNLRLGRNQLHTGLYINERFPQFGVRYIAINDNVDTENAEGKLIVDEEAAAVVRRIFALCVASNGPSQIARVLKREQILCPAMYAYQRFGSGHSGFDMAKPYNWNSDTVAAMLEASVGTQEALLRALGRQVGRASHPCPVGGTGAGCGPNADRAETGWEKERAALFSAQDQTFQTTPVVHLLEVPAAGADWGRVVWAVWFSWGKLWSAAQALLL